MHKQTKQKTNKTKNNNKKQATPVIETAFLILKLPPLPIEDSVSGGFMIAICNHNSCLQKFITALAYSFTVYNHAMVLDFY